MIGRWLCGALRALQLQSHEQRVAPGMKAMDLHGLTPLFTSLTLSVVAGVCARSHHLATDSEDVFAISPTVGYMMFGIGLFLCAAPFLPGVDSGIVASSGPAGFRPL